MREPRRATEGTGGTAAHPHVILNGVTVVGGVVAAIGLVGSAFALVAGFLNADPSAAKALVGYVVMPSVALLGMLVMAGGISRGGWRAARAAEAAGQPRSVQIEVGDWRQLLGPYPVDPGKLERPPKK